MRSDEGIILLKHGSLNIHIAPKDCVVRGKPVSEGQVVIPRRNAKAPNTYATIYEALRSRLVILAQYGERQFAGVPDERAELARLRRAIDDLHVGIAAGAGAASVAAAFADIAAALTRKSNANKAQARTKASSGPVMAGERLNRGATRARATAVSARIARRQQEVDDIVPWMCAMEAALAAELRRCLSVLGGVERGIAIMLESHEFFVTGGTSVNQRRGLRARLGIMMSELATLRIAPFHRWRNALVDDLLLNAELAIDAGDAETAGDLLGKAGVLIRKAREQKLIEDRILSLSLSARPDAAEKERLKTASAACVP
jgi:hypothetical protein